MDERTGKTIAKAANTIARWTGIRNLETLGDRAELWVTFGGGVIECADVLANAIRDNRARRYAIVGGVGHSTWGLREFMRGYVDAHGGPAAPAFEGLDVDEASEAEMLAAYLRCEHDVSPDWLETRSTNCSNNITFLLDLLEEKNYVPRTAIFSQDAVMERRMGVSFAFEVRRYPRFQGVRVAHYAYYQARLECRDGRLAYADPVPHGMWPLDEYLGLLVAEVQRLTDDERGYGPRGKGFFGHVDVPDEVTSAAADLRRLWGGRPVFGGSEYAAPKD